VNINPQIADLRRGVDILVATPGRLLDHVQQKTVDLRQVEILVLDRSRSHARHGLHPRHPQDPRAACRRSGQNLLFSATFPEEIPQARQRLHASRR
jgi:ATP-dependent RNA helicase RhlE